MTRYWLASDGIALDVAPFVAALEPATGRRALVFGKPGDRFFVAAAERLGLPLQDLLMIGDDIEAYVGGVQAPGLEGALVKTGEFRAGRFGTANPPRRGVGISRSSKMVGSTGVTEQKCNPANR
jgi:ribonucleotide monophosphatase NagD (HAD superfamily)